MATLLQVSQLGSKVLRDKAEPVSSEELESEEFQDLIDNAIATVVDVDGLGIAAPQVYVSKRLFIIASKPNSRYPNAPVIEPTVIINPEIIEVSEEDIVKDWEGCLSIPGIRGLVPRYNSIKVRHLDREGKQVEKKYNGFPARIFQHEFDHLEGLVFLDRLESNKDIVSDKEYKKVIAEKVNS